MREKSLSDHDGFVHRRQWAAESSCSKRVVPWECDQPSALGRPLKPALLVLWGCWVWPFRVPGPPGWLCTRRRSVPPAVFDWTWPATWGWTTKLQSSVPLGPQGASVAWAPWRSLCPGTAEGSCPGPTPPALQMPDRMEWALLLQNVLKGRWCHRAHRGRHGQKPRGERLLFCRVGVHVAPCGLSERWSWWEDPGRAAGADSWRASPASVSVPKHLVCRRINRKSSHLTQQHFPSWEEDSESSVHSGTCRGAGGVCTRRGASRVDVSVPTSPPWPTTLWSPQTAQLFQGALPTLLRVNPLHPPN